MAGTSAGRYSAAKVCQSVASYRYKEEGMRPILGLINKERSLISTSKICGQAAWWARRGATSSRAAGQWCGVRIRQMGLRGSLLNGNLSYV